MNRFLVLLVAVGLPSLTLGRPEAPAERTPAPQYLPAVESAKQFAPQHKYGPPPESEYGPPPQSQEYGPPPQPQYGPPPQPQYGPPPQPQTLVTKNVYIHVPPPERQEYQPTQVLEVPIPKKHYKIIFIKAPTPPTPTVPVIPETIPDEHKTLVYVLVKKPEPQPQIEIPKVKPTEPSKPEVYFIKYKEGEKLPSQYGPPPPPPGPYTS